MSQNSPSHAIRQENRSVWSRHYESSDRLQYPDLNYIHLLMRYALKNGPMREGLCLGAGDGPEAFAAARQGVRMTCLDISETAVERLRGFIQADGIGGQMTAETGDQTDLGRFPDDRFDLVVSWSVLSYLDLETIHRAIAEIRRVLRPGGSFVGLIESAESDSYLQDGAQQVTGRTYRMPADSRAVRSGVVITFLTRNDIDAVLAPFDVTALGHVDVRIPPKAELSVARWVFHARKPA